MISLYRPKNWAIFLFLPIPFLFYWYTCLPSIGLGDSALLVDEIKRFSLSTYVNTHNLTIIIGWFIQFLPFGDLAYRANLVSVLAGSLCICVFYLALYRAHGCWITAVVSALFLMVSHSMWWMISSKQEHAVDAFFISIAIYLYCCLHKTKKIKYLYALFFLSGLAFFNNMELGCILIGTSAAFLWRLLSGKEKIWPVFWRTGLCLSIGLLPYLLTFTHDVSISHSLSETISGAFGGQFKKLFFKGGLWYGIKNYLFLIFLQFPSVYLLPIILGPYFFLKSWRVNESSIGIVFTFIPVVVFFIFFNVWDKFLFMNPSFIILAFWSSFAIYKAVHYPRTTQSLVLRSFLIILIVLCLWWNMYFYSHLSRWGENPNSIWFSQYNNNYYYNCYRSNEFLANPDKRNYHDIEEFCNLVLEKLPPNSEYWDDDSRLYNQLFVYYQRYYHKRPDLNIQMINSWGFENWGADKNTFAQSLKRAYKDGNNLFLVSLGWPYNSFLSALPNKEDYKFKKFQLDDKRWVYKLITKQDKYSLEKTLWNKWETLPSDKPFTIDLTFNNVLMLNQEDTTFQENMASFGPFWKNDDQIFFHPPKQGAEIGFLLRFASEFKGKLVLTVTTANDYGIVEILFNGRPITKEPIDLYSSNVYFRKLEFENVSFEHGNNILSIRIIGKNEKSNAMKIGVDTIEIIPNSTAKAAL